jgi:hypothetical protein
VSTLPQQGLHSHQRGHGAAEEVPSEVQTNHNLEAMTTPDYAITVFGVLGLLTLGVIQGIANEWFEQRRRETKTGEFEENEDED